MVQDDMHVVIYKILAYLYDCMKKGATPKEAMLKHNGDMLHIDYTYWTKIMEQLVEKGYLKGVQVFKAGGGERIVILDDPTVTIEGVVYLKENAMMKKAVEFLKEAKSAIPFF